MGQVWGNRTCTGVADSYTWSRFATLTTNFAGRLAIAHYHGVGKPAPADQLHLQQGLSRLSVTNRALRAGVGFWVNKP